MTRALAVAAAVLGIATAAAATAPGVPPDRQVQLRRWTRGRRRLVGGVMRVGRRAAARRGAVELREGGER